MQAASDGLPPHPATGLTGALRASQRVPKSDVSFWAHEMSYSSLASTDSGYTQQPWLPDELSSHCMQCHRPFHLLRWTHHCRDCGGVFCGDCSTHRVEVVSGIGRQHNSSAMRVCDGCAFSPHHPAHLGCRNPLSCARCARPSSTAHCGVYLSMAARTVLCCGLSDLGCGVCCGGCSSCVRALDARRRASTLAHPEPPRREATRTEPASPPVFRVQRAGASDHAAASCHQPLGVRAAAAAAARRSARRRGARRPERPAGAAARLVLLAARPGGRGRARGRREENRAADCCGAEAANGPAEARGLTQTASVLESINRILKAFLQLPSIVLKPHAQVLTASARTCVSGAAGVV